MLANAKKLIDIDRTKVESSHVDHIMKPGTARLLSRFVILDSIHSQFKFNFLAQVVSYTYIMQLEDNQ